MKRALITGISGQAGSFLAELLLDKGYEVHGLVRRSSQMGTTRIEHIKDKLRLHEGDLLDDGSLTRLFSDVRPDECYNLAAQSHVHTSFAAPVYTVEATGVGAVRLLEALRQSGCPTRFYQASTSEMFGKATEPMQSESTPFHPRSPYGYSKVMAHWATINAREAYGVYGCCGILFNHESHRRPDTFVTRKITRGAARIKLGLQSTITLGNLDARRDWGFAGDYVEAMWAMLQQDKPDDYVVATGEAHSVGEFVERAFARVELDWRKHVVVDQSFFRPAEVHALCGNAAKARRVLKWEPRTTFHKLVESMVDADLHAEAEAARRSA